jgi:hypothetical protein
MNRGATTIVGTVLSIGVIATVIPIVVLGAVGYGLYTAISTAKVEEANQSDPSIQGAVIADNPKAEEAIAPTVPPEPIETIPSLPMPHMSNTFPFQLTFY